MRLRVACAIALISALAGSVGRADGDDPRAQAAAHYARGLDLANQGQYEAALDEFNAAYATSPHFAVLYNVGQAQLALGHPIEAIAALTRYLQDGADQVPLSRREQVQAQIALLETKLAELSIATDQPGATVRIDDHEVGRTPLFQPVRLAAGTHTVTASLPDGAAVTRQVTLGEAARETLELVFVTRQPAAISRPVVAAPASEPRRSEHPSSLVTLRRSAVVAASAGLLLSGAALSVYLWNQGRYEDWQNADAALQRLSPGTAGYRQRAIANNQLADSLTSANHQILGLSLAGGALLGTGAILYLVDRAHRSRPGELTLDWHRDAGGGQTAALAWSARW
jgi:tetratricopeptide (TPR) repeat protein